MIVRAVRDVLNANGFITGQLATYDFGSGAAAAIFTVDPIPKDAELPAIVITEPSGTDWNTMDCQGAEADIDVRVYDDRDRSSAALRKLAWDIWDTLHLASLTVRRREPVGGVSTWMVYDTGGVLTQGPPTALTDPDGFPGFLIPLLVRILEH